MNVVRAVAIGAAALTAVSWTYRISVEHVRANEVPFYVLAPLLFWLAFAAPLWLLGSGRWPLRCAGGVLIVPAALLWAFVVLVGFTGLKFH